MVGSRVNRGAGYGLEIIPVRYIISLPGKSGGMDQEEGGRGGSERHDLTSASKIRLRTPHEDKKRERGSLSTQVRVKEYTYFSFPYS